MEQLLEFGIFFGKVFVVVIGLLLIIAFIGAQATRAAHKLPQLDIDNIGEQLDSYANQLRQKIFSKRQLKHLIKSTKKNKKKRSQGLRKIFVVDFDGDIKASAVKHFRNEISTILSVGNKNDEVFVRLTSPGGMVHAYGLAAAQLARIKKSGMNLTISVDKMAASGGYMMACTANKIIASPFAIVGSIGVLAQVPNLHRFLKEHNIDYEEVTAGEYKRTISVFGEITDKGRKKFSEQIEDTHSLFKSFVKEYRPQVNIDQIATGEYWLGLCAK